MLPAAIAIGKNHIGTMAGKLNGLMIADRAQRLADRVHVDLGRGVLGEPALEQMRDTAGEFDDLLAAADLAERVGDHLAVLAGDDLGQLALALVEQLAEANRIAVRLASEVSRQAGNAAAAASITARASSTLASATWPVTSPVAGFVTGAVAPLLPAKGLLSIQCEMVLRHDALFEMGRSRATVRCSSVTSQTGSSALQSVTDIALLITLCKCR